MSEKKSFLILQNESESSFKDELIHIEVSSDVQNTASWCLSKHVLLHRIEQNIIAQQLSGFL